MPDNGVQIAYDLKNKTATVVVTFAPDDVLSLPEKAHLEANVVVNHLLTQAAQQCATAAEHALKQDAQDAIAEEKAKRMAELEAEFAKKEKALTTLHSLDDVTAIAAKAMAAAQLANAAAQVDADREHVVATALKAKADEETAAALEAAMAPVVAKG